MNNPIIVDAIVIGAGIIGLATAKGLADQNLKIALIDQQNLTLSELTELPTLRASAINDASQKLFEQIGVWDSILNSFRVSSYKTIKVWEKQGFAKLFVDANDYNYPNLGYIIENKVMQNALLSSCLSIDSIHTFFGVKIEHLFRNDDFAEILLENKTKIKAKLLIAADGANSFVRKSEEISIIKQNYKHNALITTIKSEKSHEFCAMQAFYPNGIIAFLPLWDPHLSCVVWSLPSRNAEKFKNISTNEFEQKLESHFDHKLGKLELINEKLVFPLIARYSRQFAKHRLVLVGDAAHSIHPLAGQGMNLGLMDVKLLINEVGNLFKHSQDFGLKINLLDYDKKRKKQAIGMLASMQIIQDTFYGENTIKKIVRGIGMNAVDKIPFIKKEILKRAMGI